MKSLTLALAGGLLFALAPLGAGAATVDDLIAKHVAARGGLEALRAIASVTETGTLRRPDFDAKLGFRLYAARPGSIRVETSLQGLTAVRAFDGISGWQVQPFSGRLEPQRLTADDVKTLQDSADFEDPLVDYRAKGNVVAYVGTDEVDGAPAYVLRAQLKNGDEQTYYLDPDAMLAIRVLTKQRLRGSEIQTVADYGDYEKVAGVWFPFEVSTGQKGSSERTLITLDRIVANAATPPSLFAFPGTSK